MAQHFAIRYPLSCRVEHGVLNDDVTLKFGGAKGDLLMVVMHREQAERWLGRGAIHSSPADEARRAYLAGAVEIDVFEDALAEEIN